MITIGWIALGSLLWTAPKDPPALFAPPVRIEADGVPIDTDVGHAAPCVCDFDGDGVQDLLVGQFGGGILWIFHNHGTNAEPRLEQGVEFKQGEKDGTVPTG